MLRATLLAVARNTAIKKLVMRIPTTRGVVARFVPGETMDECVAAVRALKDQGLLSTIDYLGEDTTSRAQADHVTEAYVDLLHRLADEGLSATAEVSVKLSAIGLGLTDGERIALDNARMICAAAKIADTTVTLDMEDHTTTDATLTTLSALRKDYPSTGAVLQAYLFRTIDDCEALSGTGSRVRLCKGAYLEPPEVAHRGRRAVDNAYLSCLRILIQGHGYPMVASHDPAMITQALRMADQAGRGPESYELQMLYGIRSGEQRRLARAGERVRVYVPYGADWYGYFIRRLAERPSNLTFFLRALAERRNHKRLPAGS